MPRAALVVASALVGLSAASAVAADADRGRAVALGASSVVSPRSTCYTCHGLDGAANGSGAFPRLTGQAAWYLYKQLSDYASGQRQNPVMSPIAKALTDQERQDVALFYSTRTAPPAAAAPATDALLIQRGGAIVAAGVGEKAVAACINCHGPDVRGLPPSFPYLAGQYAPYVELQMRFFAQGQRKNDPLGVMRHIATQLTDEEVRAVAAYVAVLPPPGPGGVQAGPIPPRAMPAGNAASGAPNASVPPGAASAPQGSMAPLTGSRP
jgi:cytochrome c553